MGTRKLVMMCLPYLVSSGVGRKKGLGGGVCVPFCIKRGSPVHLNTGCLATSGIFYNNIGFTRF